VRKELEIASGVHWERRASQDIRRQTRRMEGGMVTDREAGGWAIYDIARSQDPYGAWKRIRESSPVLDAGEGLFFVSAWDLVDQLLSDPRLGAGRGVTESFGLKGGLGFDVTRSWLMSLDGASHDRARGRVARGFTPRRIRALRPLVEGSCEHLLSKLETGLASGATLDLMAGLAVPLPCEVIRGFFGFEREAWDTWVEPLFCSTRRSEADGLAMLEGLARFFRDALQSGAVGDGLLEELGAGDLEQGPLSELEIVANAVLLVTAAVDTTAGLIGNAIRCLLQHPAALAALRANPELIERAVEETLRLEPPALSCSRHVNESLELAGVSIPAGSELLLGLGAANRDPARYSHPDDFDLDRDFTGLLSFGGGRHFCLGAALARLEARVVLEGLLAGGFDFECVEEPRFRDDNPTIRSLSSLRVCRPSAGELR